MGGDTSVTLAGTDRSIRYAQLGSLCPVSGRLPRTPFRRKAHVNPGRCTMPTPPPRHLATPRRPWRLLLFVFGLTTALLAAVVASATLLPQPEPPRRVPGVALPTSPTQPAPTSASTTTTTAPREPTTAPPPSTTANPGRRAVSGPTTTTRSAAAQAPATVGAQDTNHGALDRWRHHPAHRDRATDHGRAHHHRAHQHGSVDDHAGVHDQHCTHHRADDQRRADLDRADLDRAGHDHDWADHDRGGNDDDRAGDPVR